MPWGKERRSEKLRQKYYGAFEIIRRKTAVTFELKLPAASNVHPIFHVDLLRPHADMPKGYKSTPLPPSLTRQHVRS